MTGWILGILIVAGVAGAFFAARRFLCRAPNPPPQLTEVNLNPASLNWPSIDVIYAVVRERVALQIAQSRTLDTKANFGLGSATLLGRVCIVGSVGAKSRFSPRLLPSTSAHAHWSRSQEGPEWGADRLCKHALTAGIAALRNAVKPAAGQQPERWGVLGHNVEAMLFVNVLTILAFLTFGAVVLFSYQAYKVRVYLIAPNPLEGLRVLFNDFLMKPEHKTKAMLTVSRLNCDLPWNEEQIEIKACWATWSLRALLAEAGLLPIMVVVQAFL